LPGFALAAEDTWEGSRMTVHALEQLGPFGFQDLAQALLLKHFGPGLTPMGVGRDGGRDLMTRDQLTWSNGDGTTEQIRGYTVFQVKTKAADTSKSDVSWLWGQIRDELEAWVSPKSDRAEIPATLVFVSNADLTPFPESGGWDVIEKNIEKYRSTLKQKASSNSSDHPSAVAHERLSRVISIRVLARRWVTTALDNADSVRKSFPALMTSADAFSIMAAITGNIDVADLSEAFRDHARKQLTIDGAVWLAETGRPSGEQIPLHDIVVDLPVLSGLDMSRERTTVLHKVLDVAEHILKPSLRAQRSGRHVVVTGAAGNGKSTTAKFLVQIFRSALMQNDTLSTGQRDTVDGTRDALKSLGRDVPVHRRWPLLIDLKELMQHRLLDDGSTLMRAIATQLSQQLDAGNVTPAVLDSWYRQWPWFVMLDGFDEVTDPNARRLVIQRVHQFVEEAETANADVMVALTTRSQGYNDEMNPELFERVDLDYFSKTEALTYAQRVAAARFPSDRARQERIAKNLESASANAAQASLLRTPLQVMILILLVDASQRLEPDRYGLFSSYFDLAFQREQGKGGRLQKVLDKLYPVVRSLHEQVGFELHKRAESSGNPDPVLSERELRDLIWQELRKEGFDPDKREPGLIDEVVETALTRLVLLVPRNGGFGFDVRSLQELTAAKWIIAETPDVVISRMRTAAVHPHWRNTFLFAAGAIFDSGDRSLHKSLINLVSVLDSEWPYALSGLFPIAPRLAVEMIDDGMVRNRPAYRAGLYEQALRVLISPPDVDYASVVSALTRIALEHPEELEALIEGVRDALAGDIVSRRNAQSLQSLASNPDRSASSYMDRRAITNIPEPRSGRTSPSSDSLDSFIEMLASLGVEGKTKEILAAASRASIEGIRGEPFEMTAVIEAFRLNEFVEPLNDAFRQVVEGRPAFSDLLRRTIWPVFARTPVGKVLQELSSADDSD
jgi:hypothetical protein